MSSASRLSAFGYRLAGWPRRVAALLCLVLAVGSALRAHGRPLPSAASANVVVAARDLAVGTPLAAADLRVTAWPSSVRPPTAIPRRDELVGRRLTGALRAGEPVTTTRLMGGDITAGLPSGLVAAPVELTGTAAAGLLQPGTWVDVLASPPATAGEAGVPQAAQRIAQAVRVLAVSPSASDASGDTLPIVVAVDSATALRLAAVADGTLRVTVRPPP